MDKIREIIRAVWRQWTLMTDEQKSAFWFKMAWFTFIVACLVSSMKPNAGQTPAKTDSTYKTDSASQAAEVLSEPDSGAEQFSEASFRADTLTSLYQNGKWNGEPVKSYDGNHIASIMNSGELIVDGVPTAHYPDLPKNASYMQYEAIYRDPAEGTYACFSRDFNVAHHDELYLYRKGELVETDKVTVGDISAGIYSMVRLEHTIIMSLIKEDKIVRFDPRKSGSAKFELLVSDMAPLVTKVSPVMGRFVITTRDQETDEIIGSILYEIGETGPIKVIKEYDGTQRVRPLEDYPERGDFAEFWLLRTAYVKGAWDGKAAKISDIAYSLGVRLGQAPTGVLQNLRASSLAELDYSNVNAGGIASINSRYGNGLGSNVICIDNEPRYYLHATAPWLADDIAYRKIKNLRYDGFVEIDTAVSATYFDLHGQTLKHSPSCYFTHATTTDDLAAGNFTDYTSVMVPLPYFTSADRKAGLSAPADFVASIDIIDAVNYDNAMRAIAIGAYNEDDEVFSLYLSRKNSAFELIADNVVNCHFFGQHNPDYLSGENHYVPRYDTTSLWLNGRTESAYIDDIFHFNNAYHVIGESDADMTEVGIG